MSNKPETWISERIWSSEGVQNSPRADGLPLEISSDFGSSFYQKNGGVVIDGQVQFTIAGEHGIISGMSSELNKLASINTFDNLLRLQSEHPLYLRDILCCLKAMGFSSIREWKEKSETKIFELEQFGFTDGYFEIWMRENSTEHNGL